MLDYDLIDDWAPRLDQALAVAVPLAARNAVVASAPVFIEDALDTLLQQTDRATVIRHTLNWIGSQTVIAYHGTRLNTVEARSIQASGLKPLLPQQRKQRLERALSKHSGWMTKAELIDQIIIAHSGIGKSGRREGQVHLTLSRSGLTGGFNHYLTHGSEFDQQVAQELFGREGLDLLAADGKPIIVTVSVPGQSALLGSHHYLTPDAMIERGEVPNLVRELLEAWAFKLANPTYQASQRMTDCGIWFETPVPPEWVANIQEWSNSAVSARPMQRRKACAFLQRPQ